MDLRQLKHETEELPNVEALVKEFEKHWFKPIQKKTNQDYPFLHRLNQQHKKDFNHQLRTFKKCLHDIKYGQVVNDKLAALAHNLVELKIATVTNDYKRTKRLLNTFLNDGQLGIKQLIFEVPYLESQLSLLQQSYNTILEQLSEKLPLEYRIPLLDAEHKPALQRLHTVSKKQKKYLSFIGNYFITLTRNLKRKKEFKNLF